MFIHLILKTFCLHRHAAKNDHNPTHLFEISPEGPCFAPNQNTLCALSFLTAAYGCLVDLTVNSTSPVLLHLLMRVRVWLAESSSSARRGQNSLGRVEKKTINGFSYETIHGCWSQCFSLRNLPSDVILPIRYCPVMLALASCNPFHLVITHCCDITCCFFLYLIPLFCLALFYFSMLMVVCFLFS